MVKVGIEGVVEKCGDGHGADPSGDRSDGSADGGRLLKSDVSFEFAVGAPGDADVNDCSSGLDVVAADHLRPSERGDENVGLPGHGGKIRSLAVADGDCRVAVKKEKGHRAADDEASTDHDGVFPGNGDPRAVEKRNDSPGCAGDKSRLSCHETSEVGRMKAVYVLVGGDPGEDGLLFDPGGEGKLDKDSVDGRIAIESVDQREKLSGRGLGLQVVVGGVYANLFAGVALVGDIGLAGRVGSHENDRKPRRTSGFRGKLCHLAGLFFVKCGRKGLSIKNLCHGAVTFLSVRGSS